jgi:hypothetical protein
MAPTIKLKASISKTKGLKKGLRESKVGQL